VRELATAAALLVAIGCGDDGSDDGTGGDAATGASGTASANGGSGASGGEGASGGAGASMSGAAGPGGGGAGTGGAGASVWQPAPGLDWQWQLSDLPIDTSFDVPVYDIDLFETAQGEIDTLHASGRIVICYFSAGSWESYRPDADQYPDSIKGSPLDPPFADELWVDIRSAELRALLAARMDLAAQKNCDAVEPDNVDGYTNDNGLGLSAADQLDFNAWLAEEAHARGLSVGLKNDVDQLEDLVASFDWALNEECFSYDECDVYAATFIAAGKAVFHAEYVDPGEIDAVCAVTQPLGLSTIVKNIELDAARVACP
jgi:hypothetical protein